jgi:hypothetical protein
LCQFQQNQNSLVLSSKICRQHKSGPLHFAHSQIVHFGLTSISWELNSVTDNKIKEVVLTNSMTEFQNQKSDPQQVNK